MWFYQLPRVTAQCEFPVSPLRSKASKPGDPVDMSSWFYVYTAIKSLKKSLKFFRYTSLHFMREKYMLWWLHKFRGFWRLQNTSLTNVKGLWYITSIFREMLPWALIGNTLLLIRTTAPQLLILSKLPSKVISLKSWVLPISLFPAWKRSSIRCLAGSRYRQRELH